MSMRKPLIAGNWKMHKTLTEAVELGRSLKEELGDSTACDVVVCPPFPYLQAVAQSLLGSSIALGAQDMHWEEEGAFTGAVAPAMILTSGGSYVILGHSERRQYFGESDESVNRKLITALRLGLAPIVCVGEHLEERQAGRVEEIVLGQVRGALAGLKAADVARVTLAYEPIWAIGTGETATAAQAQEVHALIRAALCRNYGDEVALQLRILYGGSVKSENAAELFAQPNIDGGLIGGASLDAVSFTAIIRAAS
jgi:triosephosphate isomerase